MMKASLNQYFLAAIIIALFSCKKESNAPNNGPIAASPNCSVSDIDFAGEIHGKPWKVQSSSARLRYYTISDSNKLGQIKEIEVRLYDTLYKPCEMLLSPRTTPIVQINLPPRRGTFSADSFPYYPVYIFYNDTVTTSFNSITKGCVVVQDLDTNANGSIRFYLDTKIVNEYWDQQGNALRKDSSNLKGEYELNLCQ